MRELPQLVGLLVLELPGRPRFSVLGLMFPLAGLIRILLQSEDSFCCRGKSSCVGERKVGVDQLELGVLEHICVYGYARGFRIVSLDDKQEVDGVDGMESCAVLFEIFNKRGGEDFGVELGGVTHLADPHAVDDGEDEGGGAVDVRVKEGITLNSDYPDSLEFSCLVYVVLQYGGIGANLLGRGKILAVLCSVGVCRGDDYTEVMFFMGLVVARLEEEWGERLMNTNDFVVGGLPRD